MTKEEITRNFTYHQPFGDQTIRYNIIRDTAKVLAMEIQRDCPESREKSLALTNLEQAVMWANAAIARNEQPTDTFQSFASEKTNPKRRHSDAEI